MVCNVCKYQNREGVFCCNCGAPLNNQQNVNPQQQAFQYGAPQPKSQQNSLNPQYNEQQTPPPQYDAMPTTPQLPMKWYKPSVNFVLFVLAFFQVAMASSMASTTLEYNDVLTNVDLLKVFYGVGALCIIPLVIIARNKLANFKKDALFFTYMAYGFPFVLNVFYFCAMRYITKIWDSTCLAMVLLSFPIMFGNYKYFSKRKEFFNK